MVKEGFNRMLIAFALAGARALGGCGPGTQLGNLVSSVEATFTAAASAKVPAKALYAASTTFAGVEIALASYGKLPVCRKAPSLSCRVYKPGLRDSINAKLRDGRTARDAALAFYDEHPDELAPSGLYDALVAATQALQKIQADNNIPG